mgnify:CR=1 FL=1
MLSLNIFIKRIFRYKKLLEFNYESNYYCNIVLMNDFLIRKFNKIYKKQNKSTDILTFISKIKKEIPELPDEKKKRFIEKFKYKSVRF